MWLQGLLTWLSLYVLIHEVGLQRLPGERADYEACNVENGDRKALEIARPDKTIEKVFSLFV